MSKCDCEHESHWAGSLGMKIPKHHPNHNYMAECGETETVKTIYGTYQMCRNCIGSHPIPEDMQVKESA